MESPNVDPHNAEAPDGSTPSVSAPPSPALMTRRRFTAGKMIIWLFVFVTMVAGVIWYFAEVKSADREVQEHLNRLAAKPPRQNHFQAEDEKLWEILDDILPEGEPAFTAEQVDVWVEELMPLVEEAAGRKFVRRPTIKMADRKELSAALNRDFALQMDILSTFSREEVQLMFGSQALSAGLLGKYGVVDQVLYMAPANMRPLLELAGSDLALLEPMAKVVLAHELTHALQDQSGELHDLFAHSSSSPERILACNAVIEGQAVLIEDLVGRRLGLDNAVLEMTRLLTAGALPTRNPDLPDSMASVMQTQLQQIYLGGRDFMEYHFRRGGTERLWTILADPPDSTMVIARPELYGSEIQRPDLAAVLDGIHWKLGPEFGEWRAANMELGPMSLRSNLAYIDPDLAEDFIKLVQDGQAHTSGDKVGNVVSVSLFLLNEPSAGVGMFRRLEESTRALLEHMSAENSGIVENVSVADVNGSNAELGRVLTYRMAESADESRTVQVFRFLRNDVMIEMVAVGISIHTTQAIDVVNELLKRLEDLVANPATRPAGADQ